MQKGQQDLKKPIPWMKSKHSTVVSSTGEITNLSSENNMTLSSTLFLLLLSTTLVFGQSQQRDRTPRRPGRGELMEGSKSPTWNQHRQQRSYSSQGNPECQEGNPLGASYSGNMNHTISGRTCQAWSAQEPHQHENAGVGEHNHCRNPDGDSGGVWCFTSDNDKRWEYCSLPICAPKKLKVLDFSADNDHEPDINGDYTSATLEAGSLPESFTICSAFMVEAWTTEFQCKYRLQRYPFDTQVQCT